MNLKSETKTIGGYTYKVTALNAVDGRKVFVRMTKAVGPAIAAASDGNEAAALGVLIDGLNEADLDFFCEKFAEVTEVWGGDYGDKGRTLKNVFMSHFSANYFEMCEWLAFAFEVNYSSFFTGMATMLTERKTAKEKEAKAAAPASP